MPHTEYPKQLNQDLQVKSPVSIDSLAAFMIQAEANKAQSYANLISAKTLHDLILPKQRKKSKKEVIGDLINDV
jgi:hypothetical protein